MPTVVAIENDHLPVMDRRYVGSGIGRHKPAKQNHSSPAFVNFHLVFGDLLPVNSKNARLARAAPLWKLPLFGTKIDHRPALGLRGRKAPAHLCEFVALFGWRITGAVSVGQMSLGGSRFGAAFGQRTGMRIWLNAAR